MLDEELVDDLNEAIAATPPGPALWKIAPLAQPRGAPLPFEDALAELASNVQLRGEIGGTSRVVHPVARQWHSRVSLHSSLRKHYANVLLL